MQQIKNISFKIKKIVREIIKMLGNYGLIIKQNRFFRKWVVTQRCWCYPLMKKSYVSVLISVVKLELAAQKGPEIIF